jgi:hypothetical protein
MIFYIDYIISKTRSPILNNRIYVRIKPAIILESEPAEQM